MSGDNSIARGPREAEPAVAPRAFEIPPELTERYVIRSVEAADGQDRRVGLFLASDRQTPAIEIANDRILARREDAETVASLVTIARHNGWERIDVDGSPEFRKAVWNAASREGLIVSGYEPSFAEQEAISALRRTPGSSPEPEATPSPRAAHRVPDAPAPTLSDGDRRLLLTLSRHAEDHRALHAGEHRAADAFERDVRAERLDLNRAALDTALARALESPTLAQAFEAAGAEPAAMRGDRDEAWAAHLAEAIQSVRSGTGQAEATPSIPAAAARDEIEAAPEDGAVAASSMAASRPPARSGRDDTARSEASAREGESRALAELFLHGNADALAAEPRLANARQAQATMEQHIGEVFEGDAARTAAANLESRQMISDVLRRGLDVSVREPSPVRQIEPLLSHSDPER